MCLPEILAAVLGKVCKHRAVLHVVTVNNQVVGRSKRIAICLHKGAAVVRVVLFKVVLQVIVGVCRCLHHRIVDAGAFDLNPADHVRVFQIQVSAGWLYRGLRCNFLLCVLFPYGGKVAVKVRLLFRLCGIHQQECDARESCNAEQPNKKRI